MVLVLNSREGHSSRMSCFLSTNSHFPFCLFHTRIVPAGASVSSERVFRSGESNECSSAEPAGVCFSSENSSVPERHSAQRAHRFLKRPTKTVCRRSFARRARRQKSCRSRSGQKVQKRPRRVARRRAFTKRKKAVECSALRVRSALCATRSLEIGALDAGLWNFQQQLCEERLL